MEHAVPFRFLKINNYFQFQSMQYIKISENEACNRLGVKYFAKNLIVIADPNYKVKKERN